MWLQKHDPNCFSAVKEAMELQVEGCMKEEDEVAAASSSDTSIEENPEDDWFGTITQAPSARARMYTRASIFNIGSSIHAVTLTLSNFFLPVYKDILKAKRTPMRPLRC
jgi:hypothetical protein